MSGGGATGGLSPRGKPRIGRPFGRYGIALAAAGAFSLALLAACVGGQPTPTPPAPVRGIHWQPARVAVPVAWGVGPYFATVGGRLYMAGQEHATYSDMGTVTSGGGLVVWSSEDGAIWEQLATPDRFAVGSSRFFPLGLSGDGHGGLVMVGNTFDHNKVVGGVAWHSADGRTWEPESLSTDPAQVLGVADQDGMVVALGQVFTNPSVVAGENRSDIANVAWYSGDGVTWNRTTLPDSDGYLPRTISAWKRGFTVVALLSDQTSSSSAWTSKDGRTWDKAPSDLDGFDASSMVGFGDRIVAVGKRSMEATSWSSNDGREWTEATMSTRDIYTSPDRVTAVDGSLVAIGRHQIALPAVTPAPGWTAPPAPVAGVWLSADGQNWQLLAADPALTFADTLDAAVVTFGGRVVVADVGSDAVQVWLGDPVR